nr:MAG TPA: hypothetical protein [Caudoviricetes sp.]
MQFSRNFLCTQLLFILFFLCVKILNLNAFKTLSLLDK